MVTRICDMYRPSSHSAHFMHALCVHFRPGIQAKPAVGAGRGPIRGRGRGAAGSRAAGGQGRALLPGYMRNQMKRPAQEVSVGGVTERVSRSVS